MSTRLSGSLLLLVALVLLFNVGDFAAQDPAPATPAPQTTQPDLSGTYAGTFNCDALGLTGDTTLTITGNQFTTADGKTGRIVASKSGGYTAVAFQLGEMNPTTTPAAGTQPSAPQIVSMRARKSGNRLTLTSAPGSTMKCSFTTGATARGRRQRTPAATGTEVAAPATSPVPTTSPTEQPVPAQTPAPSPMPSPSPEPTPEPSPEPNPSPAPSPAPSPNPSPMPSPTVSPSPTPSPTPGPRGV